MTRSKHAAALDVDLADAIARRDDLLRRLLPALECEADTLRAFVHLIRNMAYGEKSDDPAWPPRHRLPVIVALQRSEAWMLRAVAALGPKAPQNGAPKTSGKTTTRKA